MFIKHNDHHNSALASAKITSILPLDFCATFALFASCACMFRDKCDNGADINSVSKRKNNISAMFNQNSIRDSVRSIYYKIARQALLIFFVWGSIVLEKIASVTT